MIYSDEHYLYLNEDFTHENEQYNTFLLSNIEMNIIRIQMNILLLKMIIIATHFLNFVFLCNISIFLVLIDETYIFESEFLFSIFFIKKI